MKYQIKATPGLQHPALRDVSPADSWPTTLMHMVNVDPGVDGDNTAHGCCAVENGLRRVQMDDYRDTGTFRNLRHYDIYREMNRIINGDANVDQGLQLMDMVKAAQTMGVIHPACSVVEVELDEPSIASALALVPLICGIHAKGMEPDSLNARGWADETSVEGDTWILDSDGHCVLLCGGFTSDTPNGVYHCGVGKNGGWQGYQDQQGMFLATTRWWIRASIAKPILIMPPVGSTSTVGPKFAEWIVK